MGVLKQCLKDEAMGSTASQQETASPDKRTGKMPSSTTQGSIGVGAESEKNKPVSSHRLIMNIIIR